MNLLSEILSSKIRAEIFHLLFGITDDELHMREIERRSGHAIGTVQTELKKIITSGPGNKTSRWKPPILSCE